MQRGRGGVRAQPGGRAADRDAGVWDSMGSQRSEQQQQEQGERQPEASIAAHAEEDAVTAANGACLPPSPDPSPPGESPWSTVFVAASVLRAAFQQ